MTEEILESIRNYKKKNGFKFCDNKETFIFNNIVLKTKGIIEPNYGRMILDYELYFEGKEVKNRPNFSPALDFSLSEYLENSFLFFPCGNGFYIIDIGNQKIKHFNFPYGGFGYMKRIKFSTNELLFDTDKSYWLLNYSDNSIKVF
jgi:hypothetical protein